MLGWSNFSSCLSKEISLRMAMGTPSSVRVKRIFFRATMVSVERSLARYTVPYAPREKKYLKCEIIALKGAISKPFFLFFPLRPMQVIDDIGWSETHVCLLSVQQNEAVQKWQVTNSGLGFSISLLLLSSWFRHDLFNRDHHSMLIAQCKSVL